MNNNHHFCSAYIIARMVKFLAEHTVLIIYHVTMFYFTIFPFLACHYCCFGMSQKKEES